MIGDGKLHAVMGTWDVRSLLRAQRAMASVSQMGVAAQSLCGLQGICLPFRSTFHGS